MPIPAGIAAGIGVGTTLYNAFSQGKQNRDSRKFSERMYDRQFEDNQQLWHQQNAYNDPSAQMSRLKNAGLNPMLMYGGGAGAGGAGQAGGIDTPDIQPPQFRAPQVDPLGEIGKYYDVKIKQAQTNNLKTLNTNMFNDMLIKLDQQFGGMEFGNTKGQYSRVSDDSPTGYSFRKQEAAKTRHSLYMGDKAKEEKNILRKFGMDRVKALIENMQEGTRLRKFEADFGQKYKMLQPLFKLFGK